MQNDREVTPFLNKHFQSLITKPNHLNTHAHKTPLYAWFLASFWLTLSLSLVVSSCNFWTPEFCRTRNLFTLRYLYTVIRSHFSHHFEYIMDLIAWIIPKGTISISQVITLSLGRTNRREKHVNTFESTEKGKL